MPVLPENKSRSCTFPNRENRILFSLFGWKHELPRNPLIVFLPLFIFYVLLIMFLSKDVFTGDESRYWSYASNLANGFYASPDRPRLANGPGYPLVLTPFFLLKVPLLVPKLTNAIFMYMSVLFFYFSIKCYVSESFSVCASYTMGLFPQFLIMLPVLYTDTLVMSLVCGFVLVLCRMYNNASLRWLKITFAAFCLGFLALTKILFGWVISAGLLWHLMVYLKSRTASNLHILLVYVGALLLCLPWLYYTYNITGKIFYWGDPAGINLYWMSSSYPNELGSWHSSYFSYDTQFESAPAVGVPTVLATPELARNHRAFLESLRVLSYTEIDERLKEKAISNIISNPTGYFKNWAANVGRMLFSYPYSYTPQKLSTFFYLLPNMFVVSLAVFCAYPTFLIRKSLPKPIWSLLFFAGATFGGSSLVSAWPRMFNPVLIVIGVWMVIVIGRFITIKVHSERYGSEAGQKK